MKILIRFFTLMLFTANVASAETSKIKDTVGKYLPYAQKEHVEAIRFITECAVLMVMKPNNAKKPKELEDQTFIFLDAALNYHNSYHSNQASYGKFAIMRIFRDRAAQFYLLESQISENKITEQISLCENYIK